MSDNKLRPKDRKRTLIAPLVIGGAILALIGVAFALQHPRETRPPSAATSAGPIAPAPTPPLLAAPTPPLSRRELIEVANVAAADYAAGPTNDAAEGLAGRRFVLKMPFGCDGPQVSGGASQAYYEFDPAKRTVKLVARPGDWTSLPIIMSAPHKANMEKIEGFWLPRPWSYSESCPPNRDMPVPAAPTAAAGQSLGLARVFEAQASRLLRRDGRAYELVRKIPDGDSISQARTYRLVLEGRIAEFASARPISCWAETPEHRPICLIAVEFDRVAFEDSDGKPLAEWRE